MNLIMKIIDRINRNKSALDESYIVDIDDDDDDDSNPYAEETFKNAQTDRYTICISFDSRFGSQQQKYIIQHIPYSSVIYKFFDVCDSFTTFSKSTQEVKFECGKYSRVFTDDNTLSQDDIDSIIVDMMDNAYHNRTYITTPQRFSFIFTLTVASSDYIDNKRRFTRDMEKLNAWLDIANVYMAQISVDDECPCKIELINEHINYVVYHGMVSFIDNHISSSLRNLLKGGNPDDTSDDVSLKDNDVFYKMYSKRIDKFCALTENESEPYKFKIDGIVIHKDNRDRFKRAVKLQTEIRGDDEQFEYGNTESIVKYVKEKLIDKFTQHELNCICYGSFKHPIVYIVFVCDRNQFNGNAKGM